MVIEWRRNRRLLVDNVFVTNLVQFVSCHTGLNVWADDLQNVGCKTPGNSHFLDFGLVFYTDRHLLLSLKALLQKQFYGIKRALSEQSLLIRTRADTCAGVSVD